MMLSIGNQLMSMRNRYRQLRNELHYNDEGDLLYIPLKFYNEYDSINLTHC
jgi:hypothetical protein